MATAYKPLKDQQIRLLAIVPASSPHDLRFTFWHVSVTEPIPYTAVSYAWNHDAGYERIYVEDQVLMIKRNLWKCLQCLRLTWRCIWADAICIEQGNIAELNHQVGIMGKIFANAAVVSVWLGSIVQDHIAPEDVLRERQASNTPGVHNRTLVPPLASFMVDFPVATLDNDDFSQDLAHSIHGIARAKYWTRTWIIQEFLLARKIHIYYGDAQIDEAVFRAVLLDQLRLKYDTTKPADLLKRRDVLEEWPPLIFATERQLRTRAQMKRPFCDLLAAHQDTECQDPRDVVFSLLSLIKPEERTMLNRCFPNYSVDFMIVAFVALAHLKHFAGDKPIQPLLRALKLEIDLVADDKLLLFHLLKSFDYVHSSNPAAEGHNLQLEFKRNGQHTKDLDIEDYTHKLEQAEMTLDGLYDNVCSSTDDRYLASGLGRGVERTQETLKE